MPGRRWWWSPPTALLSVRSAWTAPFAFSSVSRPRTRPRFRFRPRFRLRLWLRLCWARARVDLCWANLADPLGGVWAGAGGLWGSCCALTPCSGLSPPPVSGRPSPAWASRTALPPGSLCAPCFCEPSSVETALSLADQLRKRAAVVWVPTWDCPRPGGPGGRGAGGGSGVVVEIGGGGGEVIGDLVARLWGCWGWGWWCWMRAGSFTAQVTPCRACLRSRV